MQAQEVLISKDINVRNDQKFLLLGKIDENILLFRDRDQQQFVEVFDENLKFKYQREVSIENRGTKIYAVIPQEESFHVIYGLMDRDSVRLRQRIVDGKGELVDSLELSALARRDFSGRFKFGFSDDRNKILLFNPVKRDEVFMVMLDIKAKEVSWSNTMKINTSNTGLEFQDLVVSNNGNAYFLYEQSNNRYDRVNHAFHLYAVRGEGNAWESAVLPFSEYLSKDVHLGIDEKNKQLLLIGLFTEANRSSALGYYFGLAPLENVGTALQLNVIPFEESFINEVYGKQKKVNKTLDYYYIKDVVFKQDGGFIWIGEMYKEYFRRTNSPYGRYSRNYGDTDGYVDYYNEDLVVFSIDNAGDEEWKQVLYKKQFSQDDDAAYSSYFLMRTPSRIKLLYNDEIKRNNTVSEYMFDPMGNTHRKTVLNTEYENLRLQFSEGLQIASNALILPSFTSSNLNLVKISF